MIEKLKARNRDDGFLEPATPSDIHWKINELVDAVNELQLSMKPILEERESGIKVYEEVMPNMKPTDPYAEQRKWEGKLCWFWDEDPEDKIVDVLSCIDISDKYPYVMCDHQVHYKHCEPVKPDDDIIYKGGDNE